MKRISSSILFWFVLIAPMQYMHASIDLNWDSAWDQRLKICVSSDSFENHDVDVEIQTLFTSTQLARKFLRYELDGKFFYVLLIHNPNNMKLKSVISLNVSETGGTRLINLTVNYDKKVGIFVDKVAPQELIDHISKLLHISWWDKWLGWDTVISNGTMITFDHSSLDGGFSGTYTIYTYSPCSYYKAMKNATPFNQSSALD